MRAGHPIRMPLRLRVTLYAAGLALLVVGLVLWFGVLRDIKAPVSSLDNPSAPSRPSNAECAALINELKRTPVDQRASPGNREQLRRCLEGRR